MNLFKKIHSNISWPIWRAYLVYVLIGYAIYFAARLTPIHPEWATTLIELLKPLISELKTAERVSDQAFEVQMRTIYTFFGSMPLVVYTGYFFLFDAKMHNAFLEQHREQKTSRIKLFVAGLFFILFLSLYYYSPTTVTINPSWRTRALYAPGFGAATFGFFLSTMPMMCTSGLKILGLSFFAPHLKPETNTKK